MPTAVAACDYPGMDGLILDKKKHDYIVYTSYAGLLRQPKITLHLEKRYNIYEEASGQKKTIDQLCTTNKTVASGQNTIWDEGLASTG